jgi:hypothetical protein
MNSNLSERLRSIADTLDGCEWTHPLCAASDCRRAADVLGDMDLWQSALLAETNRLRLKAVDLGGQVVSQIELLRQRLTAELADAVRLSPAEFQKLREEKDCEINKLGNECGHLEADKRELQAELADARKAALSLYTSMLAGEDIISREQITRSALERWPWLGPAEPGVEWTLGQNRKKLCPHEAAKRYMEGARPE